jgi:hypothetical protein
MWADSDPLLTALVKGFIRHDIFAQRMFRDFSAEMLARYGAGLEGLFDRHLGDAEEPAGPAAAERPAERQPERPAARRGGRRLA